jgi:hypothetical protein
MYEEEENHPIVEEEFLPENVLDEEEQEERNNQIILEIGTNMHTWMKKVSEEVKLYKDNANDKSKLRCLKDKYPHLNRKGIKKSSNPNLILPHVHEFFNDNPNISIEHKNIFYRYAFSKIRGLYKHAQALKTGYCNHEIITGMSEPDTISFCISKNTLEAGQQWLERLLCELSTRFENANMREYVMIISSKKNTLGGRATHCKNIDAALGYLKKPDHTFKIIFVCSNKTRIYDIYQLTMDFQRWRDSPTKLRIIHDEAHNLQDGIPPFRDVVEQIVIQPNVISYMPVTATNNTITWDKSPIWMNIEQFAKNYTEYDDTKSTDPKYSSISDAIKHTFETLKISSEWREYDVQEVSEELFKSVYGETNQENMDKKRQLEFCRFMKIQREKEAVNNGLNILRMNDILGEEFYQHNRFNLHIISTPCRRLITHYLAKEAIKMDFDPIVLAIHGNEGSKYHLMGNGIDFAERDVSKIMGDGEFNQKLDELFKWLRRENINIQRPVIIIGNYNPTGESLTYVNFEYGIVRSNTRLISTNAEQDYQQACRANFMIKKFIEDDPNWTPPDKYLIGHKSFIDNAVAYEKENDARIDMLPVEGAESMDFGNQEVVIDSGGMVGSPVKISFPDIIDTSIPQVKSILDILEKNVRSPEDKNNLRDCLQHCCENQDIDCTLTDPYEDNPLKKFQWGFEFKQLRCYKKKDGGPKKGSWKFKNYNDHHQTHTSFMNSEGHHDQGQFEMLTCLDKYVLKDDEDNIIETNSRITWWIGFKY